MGPFFILLVIFIPSAENLIGYDCAGQGLNVTTLSLTEIGDCHIEDIEPIKEEIYSCSKSQTLIR
jgi:hypothetical protein